MARKDTLARRAEGPAAGPLREVAAGAAGPRELDRLIHEPGRLAILTVLSSASEADFLFLQRATGLTKGNLSSHLGKLEDAGLVAVEKRFVGRKPNTRLRLTPEGRERTARHWEQLERLKELSVRGTAQPARRSPRAAPGAAS